MGGWGGEHKRLVGLPATLFSSAAAPAAPQRIHNEIWKRRAVGKSLSQEKADNNAVVGWKRDAYMGSGTTMAKSSWQSEHCQ